MKKLTLLCLLITVCCLNSFSQEKKGYIGLSAGLSAPLGAYGSNELGNSDAGFAGLGIRLNLINFGYEFGNGFGIAANWFGAANPFTLPYNDYYSDLDGIWAYGSVMAGPMYTISLSDKAKLDLRLMAGLVTATADIDGYDSESGSGLGIDIGSTFRFNFANRWCVLANADLFSSKPEFDNNERKITSLNITGGIGYRL